MPLVDLPLDKLYAYEGRNPRPDDHDAYWARALSELDGLSLEFTRRDASFQIGSASFQELEISAVGGARLYARLAVPTWAKGPFPCVLLFHGYAWRSPEWMTLASWTAAGYAVLAMDVRGQGGKSSDPGGVSGNTLRGHIVRGLDDHPDKLFFRNVFLDTALMARVAQALPEIQSHDIIAHGASQGGGLALACAALAPEIVSRCAAVYPFLSDYKRVWEMDLAKDAYEEIKLFFRIQDPLHEREQEVFEKLGYIDVQHLAPRIRAKTLMATGLMDTICPPSSQFAAFNKISAPKETLIYPDFGHDGLPGLAEKVLDFLRS